MNGVEASSTRLRSVLVRTPSAIPAAPTRPTDAAVWFTFPESMLRALGLPGPTMASAGLPAPAPQRNTVPVLLLMPLPLASLHAPSMTSLPLLPPDQHAHNCDPTLLADNSASRLAASVSTSASVDVVISDTTLPSFGERTAAAKEMLSAAPGGPVKDHFAMKLMDRNQFYFKNNQEQFHSVAGQKLHKKHEKRGFCQFCKKNGESFDTFTSHSLFRRVDGTQIVACPQLRCVKCDICGATGDDAHTITHCPHAKEKKSVAILMKNTARRCDGSTRTHAK